MLITQRLGAGGEAKTPPIADLHEIEIGMSFDSAQPKPVRETARGHFDPERLAGFPVDPDGSSIGRRILLGTGYARQVVGGEDARRNGTGRSQKS